MGTNYQTNCDQLTNNNQIEMKEYIYRIEI